MNSYLFIAAILTFIAGLAHSLMGERFFLVRLFKADYPEALGIDESINQTTRMAWHLTTLALWCIAILIGVVAFHPGDALAGWIGNVIAGFFTLSGILSIIGSHGRQFLGLGFLLIAFFIWFGNF